MQYYFTCIYVLLGTVWLFAQEPNTNVPGPDVGSLEKYGDIPVSTYTGVPQISIPLCALQSRDIQLPFSLSYHASGIKVEEEAGFAGLGWNVLGTGMISHTPRGIDDMFKFTPKYFEETDSRGYPYEDFAQLRAELGEQKFYEEVARKNIDTQPDIFSYHIGGYSGKFIFKSGHVRGADRLETQQLQDNGTLIYFDTQERKWVITTPNGYTWVFTEEGRAHTETLSAGYSNTDAEGTLTSFKPFVLLNLKGPLSQRIVHATSWQVTRVTSPLGEKVSFHYIRGGSQSIIRYNEFKNELWDALEWETFEQGRKNDLGGFLRDNALFIPHGGVSVGAGIDFYETLYPEKIVGATGSIEFSWSAREDLKPVQYDVYRPDILLRTLEPFKLDRVQTYNNASELLKNIELEYDYFNAEKVTETPGLYKRLKLTRVIEKLGNEKEKVYKMEYFEDLPLPSKESLGKDRWGYYNGKNRNESLISGVTLISLGDVEHLEGADRDARLEYTRLGTLKRLYYPTGGHSEFAYDLHDYYSVSPVFGETELLENVQEIQSSVFPDDESRAFSVEIAQKVRLEAGIVRLNEYEKFKNKYGEVAFLEIFKVSEDRPYTRIYSFKVRTLLENAIDDRGRPVGTYRILLNLDKGKYLVKKTSFDDMVSEAQLYHHRVGYDYLYKGKVIRFPAGGLRVAGITDTDPLTPEVPRVRKYEYTQTNAKGQIVSSGKIMTPSVLAGFNYGWAHNYSEAKFLLTFIGRSSSGIIPASVAARGNIVGYDRVREVYGAQGEYGRTEYVYHNERDVIPHKTQALPFPLDEMYAVEGMFYSGVPTQNKYTNLNGSLKEKRVYDMNHRLLEKTVRQYGFEEQDSIQVLYPIEYLSDEVYVGGQLNTVKDLVWEYNMFADWVALQQSTRTVYDIHTPAASENSQRLTTRTNYTYGNAFHKQVKTMETQNSEGQTVLTRYTYPSEADWIPEEVWKAKNIRVPVVAKEVTIDGKTVSKLKRFYAYRDGKALPDRTEAAPDGQTYIPQQRYHYDAYGNPVQVDVLDKTGLQVIQSQAFIWDDTHTYMIARTDNTPVAQVAYTGFEGSRAHGGWQYAPEGMQKTDAFTGEQAYQSTGRITRLLGKTGAYRLSFWAKGSAPACRLGALTVSLQAKEENRGWTLYEGRVEGGGTETLEIIPKTGGKLDELRLQPREKSLMTTYTYKPGRGITSMTDPNQLPVYYRYDGIGRLETVTDARGNVVQRYEYHYRDQ